MTPNIDTLPAETLDAVLCCLEDGDVMNLGMACRVLRNRTAHRVFHTVRFSNDARIADSALAAVRRHGYHIRTLRFVGYASTEDDEPDKDARKKCNRGAGRADDSDSEMGPDEDDGPEPDDDEAAAEPSTRPTNRDILPPSALTLFGADTTLLPNLETFSINFDHDYGEALEYSPHGAAMFHDRENWDSVHEREAKLTMCRLWANTYKALAASKTPPPGLVLENWSPRGVSTFQTPQWRAYLSRLKTLDLSITAAAEAWHFSNSMPGYAADVARMNGFFFTHLTSLHTLTLSTWPFIPLGIKHGNGHHLPLPLKPTTLPALATLTLANIFISPDLVAFLLAHKPTLHTVTLQGAHSAATEFGESAAQPALSWAAFFDALASALEDSPEMALANLVVTSPAPLSETEAKTGKVRYKSERAAVRKVRDEIAADGTGRRRLFGYGDLHRGNGYFVECVRTNQESAIEGVDQKAYDRLVGVLEGRRGLVGGGGVAAGVSEVVKVGKADVGEGGVAAAAAPAPGGDCEPAGAGPAAEAEARVIPRRPKRKEPASEPAPPVRRSGRLAALQQGSS
jgi:hypothetical protein